MSRFFQDCMRQMLWAVSGLRELDTRAARRELWQARCNGIID